MSSPAKWLSLVCLGTLACGGVAGFTMRHRSHTGEMREAEVRTAGFRKPTEDGPQLEQALFDALPGNYSPRELHDFFEVLLRASPQQISAVAVRVQQLPEDERRGLMGKLIGAWSEIDSHAALQWAFSLDPEIRTQAVTAGLKGWVHTDSQAAQKWALSLEPGPGRSEAIFQVASAMIDENPAEALPFVKSCGSVFYVEHYNRIFASLADRDPVAAGAQALSLQEREHRGYALYLVARTWAQVDPAAALAWTERIPEAGRRHELRDSIYEQWARKDPAAVSEKALAMPDDEDRDRVISEIITGVSASDPAAGAELAMLLPPGPGRTRAMGIVAGDWAGTDLRMTLDWIAQTSDDKTRAEMVERAMGKGMESDPRVFMDYLLQGKRLPDRGYQSALATGASLWANRDADAALDWARQLEDEKVRGEVTAAVLASMSNRDPVRAADLFKGMPTRWRFIVIDTLATNWTKKDSDAATMWATQLPSDHERRAAVTACAATLAMQDSPKAVAWLNKLPEGPLRDTAIVVSARHLSQSNPEVELAWLVKISAAETRANAIEQMAWNWLRSDQGAAERWLAGTNLLDRNVKDRLQRNN
jgi:hypothetical protein